MFLLFCIQMGRVTTDTLKIIWELAYYGQGLAQCVNFKLQLLNMVNRGMRGRWDMNNQTTKRGQRTRLGVVVLALSSTWAGCNTETASFERLSKGIFQSGVPTAPVIGGGGSIVPVDTSPPVVVCDPFSQTGSTSGALNIKGELYSSAGVAFHSLNGYFTPQQKLNAEVYMRKIDVPTRAFDAGFPAQNGQTLKDANGQTLMEYFGLKFRSKLKLTSLQSEGDFQFALLSDDGARFSIKNLQSGAMQVVVNNDGDHGTRMECATSSVHLRQGELYEILEEYYQGPRYHIANILLWRRAPASGNLSYSLCGYSSNTAWFDSTQSPSVPTANWTQLIGDGWQVVSEENFAPVDASVNPCNS